MQNTPALEQQAVKAALNKEWYKAIGLNDQILKEKGDDVYALNRMGRAYAEIGDIKKAKEYFRETLKHDPINQTAEKNLRALSKYAGQAKTIKLNDSEKKLDFVIEPAITTKALIKFVQKYDANFFEVGTKFTATMGKGKLSFYIEKDKVAEAEGKSGKELEQKLNNSWKGTATLLMAKRKHGIVLLKSPVPVFKDKKQDIRPYTKHERLEEIELELPSEEE
ncbi:hypothetical protein COT69_00030 [candidate division WWE3 bacterium CG09_land_8_20_14_0_10_39_24]|uniref:Uncharacterized protein n=2 Tax=Katanobacteria TaxID=422282 RepID=A0A2G9XEB1_UNCKA|nr:MAG: hypothetical protein AUJ94_02140 [bacterium CG2_30_40_12]OJI09713.1 MAG: hypothetical protein BK003_00030 [bacterium CG09_39_24]PIP04621.1 MAG: hypothetical protein COX53_01240 [candidate division WWE3 bacterium CG23_combo_of_CG06-09_8_20_14_all_40_14]PIS13185.1 MAG: hypothetical protein COT69_00030 [candidate division WWE3 bacterium CG09_land_8_20_14_0_10_39_24]